jgi:hypothetical protein
MTGFNNKRVLLTGARTFITLDLARRFNDAGISVYVAETSHCHLCKFSNAVEKAFSIPSPRFNPDKYISGLADIVEKYNIDLLIPVYEEIIYISKFLDKFPKSCRILCEGFDVISSLHNKWSFYEKQLSYDIPAPTTYLLRSHDDIFDVGINMPIVLKKVYSRASQNIIRIKSITDIPKVAFDDKKNPWIAQKWLEGNKYCTYTICNKGKVLSHVTYPVSFAIDNSSCLTFESINHSKILKWVENFVSLEKFSGQIAFDFIEINEEEIFAIECNPRATSGVHLLTNTQDIVDAFLLDKPFCANNNVAKQLFCGMMLYGWRSFSVKQFLKTIFTTEDIVFCKKDIKPFLFQPLLFINYLYKSIKLRCNFSAMFTHDVDWNGEEL